MSSLPNNRPALHLVEPGPLATVPDIKALIAAEDAAGLEYVRARDAHLAACDEAARLTNPLREKCVEAERAANGAYHAVRNALRDLARRDPVDPALVELRELTPGTKPHEHGPCCRYSALDALTYTYQCPLHGERAR